MNSLRGKVALITGASRGIGEVTAYAFAKEGCRLALTYLQNQTEAEKVKAGCLKLGAAEVRLYQLDITQDEPIRDLAKELKSDFGQIDILVNNAGILIWKFFSEMSFEEIEQQITVNLTGTIKLTNALVPIIGDSIINVGSQAGKRAGAEHIVYCATKFAIRGFTQGLAHEFPSLKVYAVNPDGINTEMNDWQGRPPEEVAKIIVQATSGDYEALSGSDLDVWELANEK
jgi:3-oxoacyl-[acyl-carrier protein] reductase